MAVKFLIDLSAAAKELRHEPRYRKLASLISRLRDIHSAQFDLVAARDDLVAAARLKSNLEPGRQPRERNRVIGALISQALILYVRATKSRSRHRGTPPITVDWSSDLLERHNRVSEWRDDIFAHFGPGLEHAAGHWAKEATVLVVHDDGSVGLVHPYSRADFRGSAADDLILLVNEALKAVERLREERLSQFWSELRALDQGKDKELFKRLRTFEFEPLPFFDGVPESVEALYRSIETKENPPSAHWFVRDKATSDEGQPSN